MATQKTPVVSTTLGKVSGIIHRRAHAFLGIPYGASAAGEGRFSPPRPAKAWTGVFEANSPGPYCPQRLSDRAPAYATWTIPEKGSEDCLTLNVWSPKIRAGAGKPVMVWLHGGGLASGAGWQSFTDGAGLAANQDVVVVSVTHRLNVFGYLYLDDLPGKPFERSANLGQQDLVLALQWVRDNIAQFGGDPSNVTIFGQSGGGTKVAGLMEMPSATGLFHKAILQSGFGTIVQSPDAGAAFTLKLLAELGIPATKAAALRDVPDDRMVSAWFKAAGGNIISGACIIPDGDIIPSLSIPGAIPERARTIPLIVGHTATETTALFPPPGSFDYDRSQAAAALERQWKGSSDWLNYCDKAHPDFTPSQCYFRMTTAATMGRNARLLEDARANAPVATVHAYVVNWRTHVEGGKLGSPHAVEVPMVFDNVATSAPLYGDRIASAQTLADRMSASWAAFARTGNPNVDGLARWEPYRSDARKVMIFDDECSFARSPFDGDLIQVEPYVAG
ncbi:MAG: carboxylesterase/lipase family protein [Sphingobium sp.]